MLFSPNSVLTPRWLKRNIVFYFYINVIEFLIKSDLMVMPQLQLQVALNVYIAPLMQMAVYIVGVPACTNGLITYREAVVATGHAILSKYETNLRNMKIIDIKDLISDHLTEINNIPMLCL